MNNREKEEQPRNHYLRADTSSGAVWFDPSEDLLYMLFQDIQDGDETFFIVTMASDPSDQTYIQTARNDDDGTWTVEYRDGGPDRHFAATFPGHREAHAVVTAWCFGHDPELLAATAWERLAI